MKNIKAMPAGRQGFSLFEMLIVIFIFGILGALSTQIIMLSLRSSAKSESLVKVREDLNYTLSVMEREIRGASSITCPDTNTLNYTNSLGLPGSFVCLTSDNTTYYVASGSAQVRMTGTDVSMSTCSFECDEGSANSPPSVTINLQAKNTNKSGVETANMSVETQIYLRNY